MRNSTLLAVALGVAVGTWQTHAAQAESAPGNDVVVARVGTRVITSGEVARRMAAVPPFQLRSFGRSAHEVRKTFLEKVLIREALLAQGGLDARLAERDDVKERIRGVLRNATLASVRAEVLASGGASEEEIKRYYDANASKFHSPPRVAIWRIQVAKREEAQAILAELKKDSSPKRWNELARERSLDKTTSMRGGNLGFVSPDGATSEAALTVDPAIVAAVASVKDAEIAPEPVKDGERWSVLWRRQSMKAIDRPLDIEAGSIRQVLTHEKTDRRIGEQIERLRKEQLREHNAELIDWVDVGGTGELQPLRRPGSVAPTRKSATSSPAPTPRPGGVLR